MLCLVATFPSWHPEEDGMGSERDVKPFPSRPVSQIALACITASSVLIFVSVLWQHTCSSAAATMAHSLSYGSVKARTGAVAMSLGWVGVLLHLITAAGLWIITLSFQVLTESFG